MTSTALRQCLVIVGGIGIGAWLLVSAIGQLRQRGGYWKMGEKMPVLEVAARLTFGTGLFLVASLLLAGRVLSRQSASIVAPGWVVSLGFGLLVLVAVSGVVVLAFYVRRRWKVGWR